MDSSIDEFLADYADDIAALAQQLRAFVKSEVPDCTEKLQAGWKAISYARHTDFCAVMPHNRWVNVQFPAGTSLADPKGRLQGTGKAMRHVKVAQADDIDAALAQLIVQAAQLPA